MATLLYLFVLLCLPSSTCAFYKEWIPDTNFENATNWDKASVPCGSDHAVFPANRKVAVFVQAAHTLGGMSLPVDGEFILASDAGFSIIQHPDPGCGAGTSVQFKDSDTLKWFDPALWKAASSSEALQNGPHLFFVHEERVPCQHDDVVFRDASSFRVDIAGIQDIVLVKSVSVLGKKFTSNLEFSQYVNSNLGQVQFHGSSSLAVGESGCPDITGCECGNSANHERICANVECSNLTCETPLQPAGHCCKVCGVIMTIHFFKGFSLESYRQRLQHLFLALPKYKSIHMALSKVSTIRRLLGVIPYGNNPNIQVVLLEERAGSRSGTLAESLAWDIMRDIDAQGSHLGIDSAEFHASSGASSNGVTKIGAGQVAGTVLGTLVLVALLVLLVVLYRQGRLKMPNLSSLSSWRTASEFGELGGPLDHGFDNPMFEKPHALPEVPGIRGSESLGGITLTHSGVHFVNPMFDETDLDV